MQHSAVYTVFFAGAVCIVCAVLVSSSAVSLSERQDLNALLDKQKNVLYAAGLADPDEPLSREELLQRFANIRAVVIDLATGEETDIDPTTFDQAKAAADPTTSREAPANRSAIKRVPHRALVYHVLENGETAMCVIPVEGYGLWSTLYGFLAIGRDGNTIRGLTFYQHGETPGLGGEVDNPKWKALWPGRRAYDEAGNPAIRVVKGNAGNAQEAPHQVDGLSGATITGNGVSTMLEFWLGEQGFRKYLRRFREGQA